MAISRHAKMCWTSTAWGYFSISNHLVGQCVAEASIDARHRDILPDRLWGDGDSDGVRERCAEEMKDTARAAKAFGVDVVNGFTGSPVWHMIYRFPPTSDEMIDAGYREFADRWKPVLDVFASEGVKFALEAHPSEIAYDIYTAEKTLDALDHHPSFRLQLRSQPFHSPAIRPGQVHRSLRRPASSTSTSRIPRSRSTTSPAYSAPISTLATRAAAGTLSRPGMATLILTR